jgi:hypothetical protein
MIHIGRVCGQTAASFGSPLEIHDPSTKASIVKGLGKLLCTFFIVGNQNKVKVWQFTTH